MERKCSVLILTAGYGNGHNQAANALAHSLRDQGCGLVRIMDLFEEAYPGFNAFTRYLYMKSPLWTARGLDVYGWIYRRTRNMTRRSVLAKWFNTLGASRLLRAVKEYNPSAIVTTFPFCGIPGLLRRRGMSLPLFTVVTDYQLHNRWLLSDAERYYVATEDLKRSMMRWGVDASRITVSGIPVREAFHGIRRVAPDAAKEYPVLVMPGACSTVFHMRKMAERLLAIPGVRLEMICGRNKKMLRELGTAFASEPRVRLYGYVESIHEPMRRAYCMVTKAGGITLSEALHVRLPLLIHKPLPGQERENAQYFADRGAAWISDDAEQLARQIRLLMRFPQARRRMAECQAALVSGAAAPARFIARDILDTIVGGAVERAAGSRRETASETGRMTMTADGIMI
jgi:processive 1,2-diacylglycerol beta-glucosyltransferase